MKFGVRRWVRGFRGLIRHGGLIGIHGSATVSVAGKFEFGKGVSVTRNALIQVPKNANLRLGNGVHIGREAEISPDPEIVIGDFTSVQDRCIFIGHLSVGAHCLFAPNVMMSSATHHFREKPAWLIRDQDRLLGNPEYRSATPRHLRICVEDDCWIGINSVIMRGVTIGRGSVVGANSVVTRSVAPYSVVAGSPARLVERRLDFVPPRRISGSNPEHLPYFYSGFDLRQQTISAFPTGVRAMGRCQVALDCTGCKAVRVELEADEPVILRFLGQQQALHAGRQSTSFTVDSVPQSGVLLLDVSDMAGRPLPVTIREVSAES
jgi:acetyltransferase-like isoleucine patch superfamily enzyme